MTMSDFMFIMLGIAFITVVGAWAYFVYHSPQIITETTRSSSATNRVYRVRPDDERLPNYLLIPWGGYASEGFWLARGDLKKSGGAFIVPSYMVEEIGSTLMIHGEPLLLSAKAVAQNRWLSAALEKFESYSEGESQIYIVHSGEGPPLDVVAAEEEKFHRQRLLSTQSDHNRKIVAKAERAVSMITDALQIASDAWRQEAASKILAKQTEIRKAEDEGSTEAERP
jgi:hypothetical protein